MSEATNNGLFILLFGQLLSDTHAKNPSVGTRSEPAQATANAGKLSAVLVGWMTVGVGGAL